MIRIPTIKSNTAATVASTGLARPRSMKVSTFLLCSSLRLRHTAVPLVDHQWCDLSVNRHLRHCQADVMFHRGLETLAQFLCHVRDIALGIN